MKSAADALQKGGTTWCSHSASFLARQQSLTRVNNP